MLSEFERLLSDLPFSVHARRLEPDLMADPAKLAVPRASVYVVECHEHRPTTEALVVGRARAAIRPAAWSSSPRSSTSPAPFRSFASGAKGLMTFADANEQLGRAVEEVASGGFWVPRSVLSRFVDETISTVRRPRGPAGPARLSRREREVLDALLENLSNKEIASKLNMSERTAKFHVSNLLAKYGVRRRADLILLTYTQLERPA